MTSPRTACFVYFALLFGTVHANNVTNNTITQTSQETQKSETTKYISTTINGNNDITTSTNTSVSATSTSVPKNTQSVCTPPTSEPAKGQCIFLLPTGDALQLVVVALTVGCLALLLTTLICACQLCHLRGIISSVQLRHNNVDLRAIREKSESPYRDEGQVDGQPTETCLMLSEVTTAQEESREDEERVLEKKTEENKDTEQPSTEKGPNGDVTQENSHEPDAKAPESADIGV